MIREDIQTLKLTFAEGPDEGGSVGPYRQSERHSFYAQAAQDLLKRGIAYYCFCSEELLTQKREVAMKLGKTPHYDGTCLKIPANEASERVARGEKAGLRFKAFKKNYILKDAVRGDVEFKDGMVGDFFITRTPRDGEAEIASGIGMPVYNFCCVVDDHYMGMTHIIRGEDHLSNTARQLMIYDAFNWELPVFAHIAMVLGSDRQKLSKRNGDSSVHDYLEKGYLPEALLNFIALLGWWPPNDLKPVSGHPELLSLEEMVKTFTLDGLQKAPGVFDVQKLQWMNGQYLKMLPIADIVERAKTFIETELKEEVAAKKAQLGVGYQAWLTQVIDLVRVEVQLLNQLPAAAKFYFSKQGAMEDEAKTVLNQPEALKVIQAVEQEVAAAPFTADAFVDSNFVESLQKKLPELTGGLKGKALFMPFRAITTGKVHGAELKKSLPLFTKSELMERIQVNRKLAGV
jgi:nondiscriminating glutamyl-tRNA synthetase